MNELRKAAEMALEALDYEAREEPESIWIAEREALRQALAPEVTPEVAKRKALAELLSATPVDETVKHEYVLDCPRCGHCCQKREWVGFTDGEKQYLRALGFVGIDNIESRLKRMNT